MCEGIGAGGQAGMLGVVVLSSGSWNKGAQQWREWVGAAWDPPTDTRSMVSHP